MKTKLTVLLAFLLVGMVVLAGCFQGNTTTEKEPDGTTEEDGAVNDGVSQDEQIVNLIAGGNIPTLRTNGRIDGLSSTMMSNIFEGLYRFGPENDIIEGIAHDVDISDDGYIYTFHLREDAKWSNGTPVTAHDFIYAWRKALHPDTISPHATLMNEIKNAREVQDPNSSLYGKVEELGLKAVTDHTLEVELSVPIPYFLNLVTHPVYYPQNEEFVEAQGDNYALEPEHLIANGPFVMTAWQQDASWVLERNDHYWDHENVRLDAIHFNVVKDDATAVNLYEVGEVDMVNLSAGFVDLFEDHENFSTSLQFEMYFLRLNQKNEYLANRNIRKAIDMAWNKVEAAELILKNGSKPIYYLIPEEFIIGPDGSDFRDKYGSFNTGGLEEAKEYWEKGLAELGTDSIALELLSYDDDQRSTVAEYIRHQLQTNLPGLTININQQPNNVKLELEDRLDYDISHSGWRGSVQDAAYFLEVFLSDGPYNWQNFKNDRYDELVRKAQTDMSDPAERFAIMQEAEKILIEEEVVISPMYQAGTARLIQPYVKGFVAHPNTTFSYKWMYVDGKN